MPRQLLWRQISTVPLIPTSPGDNHYSYNYNCYYYYCSCPTPTTTTSRYYCYHCCCLPPCVSCFLLSWGAFLNLRILAPSPTCASKGIPVNTFLTNRVHPFTFRLYRFCLYLIELTSSFVCTVFCLLCILRPFLCLRAPSYACLSLHLLASSPSYTFLFPPIYLLRSFILHI